MAAKPKSKANAKKSVAKKSTVKMHVDHVAHHEEDHKKAVCPTCGYGMIWLHSGDCPLCRVCVRCGNRVRHCTCMESE